MIFEEHLLRNPNHYPWTDTFINTAHAGFWTDREFNFNSDIQDFRVKMNGDERLMTVRSLSTIGQVEIDVKKFWAKIGDNLPHSHIYDLGYTFAGQEVIHGRAYERLLNTLGIKDAFDEILQEDFIKRRVSYLRKHLHKYHSDNKKQFIYSLILFTLIIENISLFSQFYVICWFGRFKNYLKDTNKQVEYTSREETLHMQAGIKIINTIREEHPELFDKELEDKVLYEFGQALKYEDEILKWMVSDYDHEYLSFDILSNLNRSRGNNALIEIGYPPIFEIDSELVKKTTWFDEQLLGNNMTDFFNSRPTEYSKTVTVSEDDLF